MHSPGFGVKVLKVRLMARAVLLFVLCGTVAALVGHAAHHPVGADYDESQTLSLTGTLVTVVYRNPHSLFHLAVTDREAGRQTWAVEWRAADRLQMRGIGPGAVAPGDRVIVCGHPGRDPGQYRLWLLTMTRPADGWSMQASPCEGL